MEKLFKYLGQARTIEWMINKLIPVAIFFFGGTIQVALAKFTPWLNEAGPIIYSATFFAGAFLSLIAYSLFLSVSKKRMILNYAKSVADDSRTNPLETEFTKRSISTADFFSPFYLAHKKKRFTDCNIVGTGSIFLQGCLLKDVKFKGGQIIILKENAEVMNVTIFDDCNFNGGVFIACTLFMFAEMYKSLPEHMKQNIPVISSGI